MIENGIINRFQLWILVVNFILNSAILILPSAAIYNAKQDGWLAVLFATFFGIIFALIYIKLAEYYPNKTLVNILETVLGKYIGKGVAIMYAWFFLHLSALVIRDISDFITTIIMPDTPKIVFAIMAGMILYYTVYHGVETIARSNEVFTPYAAVGIWLTIFLLIPEMNVDHLLPVLQNGYKPVIKATYPLLGFPFTELVVFLMIFPFINAKKTLKRDFLSAIIVAGLTLSIVTLSTIMILNVKPSEMSIYATFNMARLVNIGQFLTRVEVIIALAYLVVIYTKMAISFYGGMLAIAQVFNLTDYRPIIMPLLIIVISLSIILNKNVVEVIQFANVSWVPYSILFGIIIPLILLILSRSRNKTKHLS